MSTKYLWAGTESSRGLALIVIPRCARDDNWLAPRGLAGYFGRGPQMGEVMSVSRRDFLGAGAAAAAGLALPQIATAMPVITVRDRSELARRTFAGRPVIISSANGADRDESGKRGIEVAWELLSKGGDPL